MHVCCNKDAVGVRIDEAKGHDSAWYDLVLPHCGLGRGAFLVECYGYSAVFVVALWRSEKEFCASLFDGGIEFVESRRDHDHCVWELLDVLGNLADFANAE